MMMVHVIFISMSDRAKTLSLNIKNKANTNNKKVKSKKERK